MLSIPAPCFTERRSCSPSLACLRPSRIPSLIVFFSPSPLVLSVRVFFRYEHRSALPTSAFCPSELGAAATASVGWPAAGLAGEGDGVQPRETKLELLLSAKSPELAGEASREACLLAPGSLYLGGGALQRLASHFRDISLLMQLGEEEGQRGRMLSLGDGSSYPRRGARTAGDGDPVGGEFDAYKEILEAAAAVAAEEEEEERAAGGGGMSCPLSGEEVERLERMRDIVQPSASRAVGAAAAYQALDTVWRKAAVVAAV